MGSPKIETFREVVPYIYSWKTPDIPKYDGWEKIGYTEQDSDTRIAQQASQLNVKKIKVWAYRATFMTEDGGAFRDSDFHAFLKQQGIKREYDPVSSPHRTEWHEFASAPKLSQEYFFEFASKSFVTPPGESQDDYKLRPEQQAAVAQAVTALKAGEGEVLWNAKPRFGKTLTTYQLLRDMDVRRALIVTNRPAIANSWYDDYQRFIGHQTTYQFVSESSSLSERSPMTREQWRAYVAQNVDGGPRIIEFVSLQDIKGSQYFGGSYAKLKHIAEMEWDLLIIDEAHEGIDTTKTDIAFDQIKRSHTLHLSGTPFKALASGRFTEDQIFNWTYEDEQTARDQWSDDSQDNPYATLPTLNLLTYQLSRMVADRLAEGVALEEDEANVDYTFDLAEFFRTKDNGFFEHEAEVSKFLDTLTTNEKYPFSTRELRDEIRHSFWLLNRVSSAKALERLLKKHDVFKDYTIILAAGDGRSANDESLDETSNDASTAKSLDRVKEAIKRTEAVGGKTITLSVGQLTTGVTVPEWTAVIMLSNISSPALYTQAAFRAQNPHTFVRSDNAVLQKKNAYIFDFAPERTLTIFDEFANNLALHPPVDSSERQDNIRRLLNFFPVLGEDSEGRMIELDAAQVLTFPRVFKAREVVRRGFLSNLLFANVGAIFRYSEHVKNILDKLPTAKQGKVRTGQALDLPHPPPITDSDGNVKVDADTVINPKVAELGKPIWSAESFPPVDPNTPASTAAARIAEAVTSETSTKRTELQESYGLTAAQVARDTKTTEAKVKAEVERAYAEHTIAQQHLEDEAAEAATEAEAQAVEIKRVEAESSFQANILDIVQETMNKIVPEVVTREETKKVQKQADKSMDDARSHLRGFARTIPMFLMAYGHRDMRLGNFDDYTPDDVFEEITGISEAEFRTLRDGQTVTEDDGTVTTIPGLFDEDVFNQAIQEFLTKKEDLADYFNPALTEDIFAYVPQQKTSLVFTPKAVVMRMVDTLELENPGIFSDPTKTFADPFSTAGLFVMEFVRRLDTGLAETIPDQDERLRHILTSQIYEMSHNEILHRITIEGVSGGVEERKTWIEGSGHFRVGNLAYMTSEERAKITAEMLGDD
ncbi:DEAD/DEAH box helicase [Aeromicrobium sp. Root472D3]|uniref:DEAD/DEAH box helicase n=1 Tax=Aeromicrobium sp. Root472D3 TaxID=1736540 RepID=UPI0006F94C82|nr:DEAD/DEAH box helicase family protein [Aeromicrobium sp. Root472D3]KQX72388.1 restriction endonuclease subunit R [Aeromicrobium sp. Root472D3]